MDNMIEEEIKNCGPCQCNIDNTTTEPIAPTSIPPKAWHQVDLDFRQTTIC